MSKKFSFLCFYIRGLKPAYTTWTYAYATLFLHTQVCSWGFGYIGMGLHTQGPICVCRLWPAYVRCLAEALLCPFSFIFQLFRFYMQSQHLFCHFCIWTSLRPSFYLYSWIENTISHQFFLNQEYNVIFFFCSPHPFMLVGEAPTKWWNGTTFSFLRLELISGRWALSLSLAFIRKGLQVPP